MTGAKALLPFLPMAAFFLSSGALAIKVPTGSDDINLNVNVLLQVRGEGDFDGPPTSLTANEGASPGGTFNTDFYLRRARLIATGSAYQYFIFNIMLDTPFFGRRGNFGGSTFVQDLAVGVTPVKDIIFEAGFLFMPFSHQSPASGASGSTLENLGGILANLYNNQRGLRQTGAQVRALILDRRILIRGGVYEGARATTAAPTINRKGRPLFGGMLRLNLVGDETAYAYPGIYMDGKTRVSIGVGGQYQNNGSNVPVTTVGATGNRTITFTGVDDYRAYSADAFVDLALPDDNEFVFQGTGYRFDWGQGSDKTGYGVSGELGYRWHEFEPQTNFYWFNSDSRQNSFLKVAGGLNWFLKGSQARISLEFGSVINAGNLDTTPAMHQILLQAQLWL